MAKETVHEDFGEKIGGAKKDLWAARGLYVDDLLGMNEREADKYVKKDNVWKKPDYNALIQSGVPVDILYFRKVVRDSLNASLRYLRSDDMTACIMSAPWPTASGLRMRIPRAGRHNHEPAAPDLDLSGMLCGGDCCRCAAGGGEIAKLRYGIEPRS